MRGFELSRRSMLGLGVAASAGWLAPVARALAADPQRKKSLILLWMDGGPATIDMWDLKPGHANGGPIREIDTATPGVRISEHLPELSKWTESMAIVRSMTSKEGDHGRGSHLMRAGYTPQGAIQFPAFGAVVAREIGAPEGSLPPYVTISPPRNNFAALGGGFLGPAFNPLTLGGAREGGIDEALKVPFLARDAHTTPEELAARQGLLARMNARFSAASPAPAVESRAAAAQAAASLMQESVARSFQLSEEPEALRDRYGRSLFGQGLLMARRLIERGVPCVEAALTGWDTHGDNFAQVADLSRTVDRAWSALMEDLRSRGLLDTTLIVWMGEFGRTPKINGGQGRDHWPQAFSAVLAGGGIRGGQTIGRTSFDGTTVEDRPVKPVDLLATICRALGVDPTKQNLSNVARPIRVVDPAGKAVGEALA